MSNLVLLLFVVCDLVLNLDKLNDAFKPASSLSEPSLVIWITDSGIFKTFFRTELVPFTVKGAIEWLKSPETLLQYVIVSLIVNLEDGNIVLIPILSTNKLLFILTLPSLTFNL